MNTSAPAEVVRVAIGAGRTPFESYAQFELAFQRSLGCELDYVRRLLGGTRVLTPSHERLIGDLLGIRHLDLRRGAREAAKQLGLNRAETARILPGALVGFDFAARTTDRQQVEKLEATISGYWECYYWSVSRVSERAVNRELLIIQGVDSAAFINCRIVDLQFTNVGIAFPVLNHLYFFLEKDELLDEIAVHLTNRPDRTPAVLRGLMLCLSGGADEIHSYPSAGKTSYRYLGRTASEIRAIYSGVPHQPDELEAWLCANVPRYILESELPRADPHVRRLVEQIDNTIAPDATPFALRSQ
jgi:hypothetical protein